MIVARDFIEKLRRRGGHLGARFKRARLDSHERASLRERSPFPSEEKLAIRLDQPLHPSGDEFDRYGSPAFHTRDQTGTTEHGDTPHDRQAHVAADARFPSPTRRYHVVAARGRKTNARVD
jgi:hypothetical protein